MTFYPTPPTPRPQPARARARVAGITGLLRQLAISAALLLAIFCGLRPAQAQVGGRLNVSPPNGYANVTVEDMRLKSVGGDVRWTRVWDSQEWKFNPQWESLSQSWKNLTGSQTQDTTGGTVASAGGQSGGSTAPAAVGLVSGGSAGGSGGCSVWVDEDWQPSSGTVAIGGNPQPLLMAPGRTTPFNRYMGELQAPSYPPVQIVNVDYAALCGGSSSSGGASVASLEGVRRINELYLGESGRLAFNNRSIVEKRAVKVVTPLAAAAVKAQLAAGQYGVVTVSNPNGFRWIDKMGDWIDYNTQGQAVSYGDRNDNTVWLARDTAGIVHGVVDANGRTLMSLIYSGDLLIEIKDYAIAGQASDLAARGIKYTYDSLNRLTKVTDARGNDTQYAYDARNRLVKITDPEGRDELLVYEGDVVKQYTAPDGGVTDYLFEYDDTNKQFVSKITGPETTAGRRTEDFTHNRAAKLVRRIVNGRVDEEIRRDTAARVEINTNARGFTTRTTKNEFELVTDVVHPDGATQKFSYSALHLEMTEAVDELGFKTQYQHDTKGNVLKSIQAAGTADERVVDIERNSLGQPTKLTRKGRVETVDTPTAVTTPDAVWQLEYDAQGQIKKTTDPQSNVRYYTYDRMGNLASFTDPRGSTSRYEVNANGSLVKFTDPLARVRTYSYDKSGNLTSQTDARGKATQAAYDAVNRRTQVTNPVGGASKVQYNAQGLPIQETDEDGRVSRAEFDNFLRLTKQIDGLGNTTQQGYNVADGSSAGSLGALFDPTDTQYPTFTQRQRFDQRERPTNQTLLNANALGTEGLVSSTEYDKRGQVKSATDANGKTRYYTYDALGQMRQTTDSLGNKTQAAYDVRGNLLQITDAKGNINQFAYDKNNRVTKEVLPLGQTTSYSYDAAGNLKERIDPNGHKTTYSYDSANRVTEVKQYKLATTLIRTTSYTWDAEDNLSAWSDIDNSRPAGQQTASGQATYDDASRKTSETTTYPSGYSLKYSYTYSLAGKKTQLTWPDSTAIGYSYSQHGQLESASIPGEGNISVAQFKWLEPAQVTLPGGTAQDRTLDGLLNLESLKVKTPGQQTVLSLANAYGKVQELKTSNRSDSAGAASSTKASQYSYDDETRLTQAKTDTGGLFGTDTENFTLDAVGNRIAHSKVSGAWQYDANNRLTQRGAGSCTTNGVTCYDWDEAGNLTKKTEAGKTTQYSYDTQNRLIEVNNISNAQASVQSKIVARYGYDPQDRRIWKEQYKSADGQALAQAVRTYYLYANEGLIAESTQAITLNADGSVTAGAAPQITTQYGPRPDSEFTTGMLFVKTNNSNNHASFAYLHHDHLQTPLQATDKQGNVVWAASYNAFGKAAIITPAATVDKPTINLNLRLPGQYLDEETGLHYNWHRYYDNETGRYVTADPIGLTAGLNRYVYAAGAPSTYVDPMGLQVIPIIPPIPIPGVPNPSLDAQRDLVERLSRPSKNDQDTTYQTYTRYNPRTGDCYSGRTSGTADPKTNIKNRSYGQPLLNAEGFAPPVLDRSSSSASAIRGREQQVIEVNGGARSSGGDSRNMINGIRPLNPAGPIYRYLATEEFGTPVPAGRCTCQ